MRQIREEWHEKSNEKGVNCKKRQRQDRDMTVVGTLSERCVDVKTVMTIRVMANDNVVTELFLLFVLVPVLAWCEYL